MDTARVGCGSPAAAHAQPDLLGAQFPGRGRLHSHRPGAAACCDHAVSKASLAIFGSRDGDQCGSALPTVVGCPHGLHREMHRPPHDTLAPQATAGASALASCPKSAYSLQSQASFMKAVNRAHPGGHSPLETSHPRQDQTPLLPREPATVPMPAWSLPDSGLANDRLILASEPCS